MANNEYHRQSKRVNLNGENVEDILDSIEQSRRITKLIIAAVQKGSKFEVSQILEHYGLPMTSRLHFGVINVVMEQWFSLMGIEEEEQIWKILTQNRFAMSKLKQNANAGTMVLSDILTEWELGIGALQSKIIRRTVEHFKNAESGGGDEAAAAAVEPQSDDKSSKSEPVEENKDAEKETNPTDDANGSADVDKKEDQ